MEDFLCLTALRGAATLPEEMKGDAYLKRLRPILIWIVIVVLLLILAS